MRYCTSIGIDTHAKKNTVCALVKETGEIFTATLSADPRELIRWIEDPDFYEFLFKDKDAVLFNNDYYKDQKDAHAGWWY